MPSAFLTGLRKVTPFVPLVLAVVVPRIGVLVAAGCVVIVLMMLPAARRATLSRGPWPRSIGIGVLCGTAIALIMQFLVNGLLTAMLGTKADLSAFGEIRGNTSAYVGLLVLGLVYGPIVEESIFRGFAIGWGTEQWGRRATPMLLVLSAVIFGLTHLYQGWFGVCSTGIIGLGYGIVYISTKQNLLAAIFAHMTLNAIGIMQLYI